MTKKNTQEKVTTKRTRRKNTQQELPTSPEDLFRRNLNQQPKSVYAAESPSNPEVQDKSIAQRHAEILDKRFSTFLSIIRLISEGATVREATRKFGHTPCFLFDLLSAYPFLREEYEAAIRIRASIWADECVDIADTPVRTTAQATMAKLQIATRQWVAERHDPGTFSIKSRHEFTGPNGGPLLFQDELRRKIEEARKAIES